MNSFDILIQVLMKSSAGFRWKAAEILEALGWEPQTENEKVFFLFAKRKWDEILPFGNSAIGPLLTFFDEDKRDRNNALEILEKSEINNAGFIEPLIKTLLNDPWRFGESLIDETFCPTGYKSLKKLMGKYFNILISCYSYIRTERECGADKNTDYKYDIQCAENATNLLISMGNPISNNLLYLVTTIKDPEVIVT